MLSRPKIDPYLSREDRRQFVELLGGVTRVISIPRKLRACRDPKDDKCLDVAVNGKAAAIISGDRDLLELDPFHAVRIVSPADFLIWP